MKNLIKYVCGILLWGCLFGHAFSVNAADIENTEVQDTEEFMRRVTEIENRVIEEETGRKNGRSGRQSLSARAGGNTIADVVGMNGEVYIDWLKSHENDEYYLMTPYIGYDWRSPNGDTAFNGEPGMNCTGFIWHALMYPTYLSGGNTDAIPGLSGWVDFYRSNDIERRYFATKEEMLTSGYAEKGDIIWIFEASEDTLSPNHHIIIYWGDGYSDVCWHSINGASGGLGLSYDGNIISPIVPEEAPGYFLVLKAGGKERTETDTGFLDVPDDAWFHDAVKFTKDSAIMTGMNSETFAPEELLTRGQFATVLYRVAGQPETLYKEQFPDIGEGIFYSAPVLWASEAGVVTGYESGYFGPEDNITREQLAVMMYRYAESRSLSVSVKGNLNSYPDGEAVSGFAKEAVRWAIGEGIITGDQGMINPQGNANRAHCAMIIKRFIDRYGW